MCKTNATVVYLRNRITYKQRCKQTSGVSPILRFVKGEDIAGWITVDAKTGQVSTNKILDRESPFVINSTYRATLYAVDDGKTLPFTILGVNKIFLKKKLVLL